MENTVDTREAKIEEIKTKFKFGGKFGKIATTAITGVALATGGALAQDQPTKTNLENTQEITCPTPDESIENIAASLAIPQKDSEPICLNVVFGLPEGHDEETTGLVLVGNTMFLSSEIKKLETTDPEDFSIALLVWTFSTVETKKVGIRAEGTLIEFNTLIDWAASMSQEERLLILHSLGYKGLLDETVEFITDLNKLVPKELQ